MYSLPRRAKIWCQTISNFKNNGHPKQKQKLRAQYDYQSNNKKTLYKDHSSCCFSEFNLYYYLIMLCWLLRKPSTHQFSFCLFSHKMFPLRRGGGGNYNKLFNTVASICLSLSSHLPKVTLRERAEPAESSPQTRPQTSRAAFSAGAA